MFGAGNGSFGAGVWGGQATQQFSNTRGEGRGVPFGTSAATRSEPSALSQAVSATLTRAHTTAAGVGPTPTSMSMAMGGMPQHVSPYHMGLAHFPRGLGSMASFHAMLASGQLPPAVALQGGVSRAQAQAQAQAHFGQMERIGALQRELVRQRAAAAHHMQVAQAQAQGHGHAHGHGHGHGAGGDAGSGNHAHARMPGAGRSEAMSHGRSVSHMVDATAAEAGHPQMNPAAMAMLRDAAMGMGMVMGAPGPMGQPQPYSQAVASLLAGLARPVKVCRTCNKSHDHVHHLPISGAVRAIRLSDGKDSRVDICGGCYKWAKRHFAGGHRRCDGGTIRRNCQERLDVARKNGLLLVRWDDVTGASEEPAAADSRQSGAGEAPAAVLGGNQSGADAPSEGDDAERPKSRASSTTSTSISADQGEAESSVGGRRDAPNPPRRRVRATKTTLPPRPPVGSSRALRPGATEAGTAPPVVMTGADVVDADFCVSMMPSPANALLPSPSCAATNGVLTAVPAIKRVTVARAAAGKRRRARADSKPAAGAMSVGAAASPKAAGAKRRRTSASAPGGDSGGLLGVLAAVACNSPNAKSQEQQA